VTAPASGSLLWFDASDPSTLFQNSAGTIPVTAAGQPIGLWRDKSGHGYDATQTSSTQKPTYVPSSQNGLAALNFTPGADFAHDQGLTTSFNGPLGAVTAFVVYKMDTWNQLAWARLLDKGWDSSFFVGAHGSMAADSPQGRTGFGGGSGDSIAAALGTDGSTFHYLAASRSARLGAESLWLDGAAGASGVDTSTAPDNKFLAIGFDPTYATHTDSLRGSIAEVLVYGSQLSDIDRQNTEAYLRSKWFGGSPGANRLSDAGPVTVSAGATLDATGISETIGPLDGGGNVLLGGNGSGGTLTINSVADSTFAGSVSGAGTLAKAGSGTLTLAGQSTSSISPANLTVTGGKVNVSGMTTLNVGGAIALNAGAALAFASNSASPLTHTTQSLTLGAGASMDLGHDELSIASSSAATVRGYVQSAYTPAGNWNGGSGITSSLARSNPAVYTVAYADGNDVSAQDAGLPLSPGQVLVRPTLVGDANLDGKVDFFDISQLLAYKYNTGQPASYTDGDLNYDGVVDFFDLSLLLSANYNTGQTFAPGSEAASAVNSLPEPSTAAGMALLLAGFYRRRRRRAPTSRCLRSTAPGARE
jgi:hypothetical protein